MTHHARSDDPRDFSRRTAEQPAPPPNPRHGLKIPAVSRRRLLASGACSLAAMPLFSPVRVAAAPGDNRLVVIILRGGADGLDVIRPQFSPEFKQWRPGLHSHGGAGGPLADGFTLNPALEPLRPFWDRGELGFIQAVATPYRNKRSHFDGQDILENGGASTHDQDDGWMNRLLSVLGPQEWDAAWAVGQDWLRVMDGPQSVVHWAPDLAVDLRPAGETLWRRLTGSDPLFGPAAEQAIRLLNEEAGQEAPNRRMSRAERVAQFVASQLRDEGRIAAFSISGFDTHRNQSRGLGRTLQELQAALAMLRTGLGPVWGRTAVLAVTEFGRTVRENGAGGTDHGTGGVAIYAGGALRGGQILGQWPGLAEADLFARRDLMPTSDVRAWCASAIHGLFGVDRSTLSMTVFPGLDLSEMPNLMA